MRRLHFAVLAIVVLAVQPVLARTYYVGSCKTGAFGSIQSAVSTVPAGSVVEVCPGTYFEQVIIDEALTLEAIPNAGGSVVISDAGVTLTPATSIWAGTVSPQVWVTAGPVNITNIGVSQTTTPPPTEFGIFYASGSSGTVKGTEIQGTVDYIGIVAENGAGPTQSVTIESNYLNGQMSGIFVDSNQDISSLTVTVKNNFISIAGGGVALQSMGNAQGSISNNFVTFTIAGEGQGVWSGAQYVSISGNWIYNCSIGINSEASSGATVTLNQIFNCITGIAIGGNGANIKTNGIFDTSGAIEFDCTTGNTVTGNIINQTATGLDRVPSGFTGSNTYYNVGTITTGGCVRAAR